MRSDATPSERTPIGWHPITLGLVLVVALSMTRVAAVLAMKRWWGRADLEPSAQGALFLLGLFLLVSVGIVGGGLFGLGGASWERLGWRRERLAREIARGVLAAVVLGLVMVLFAFVGVHLVGLKPPERAVSQGDLSAIGVAMSVLFGFLIASWSEENLFRGYLQPLLIRRWGLWPGIIAQAALFSVAHIGYYPAWPFFALALATGVILGWLRGRDGSLVAPFVAHGLIG